MVTTALICPICQDKVEKLLYRYHLDSERVIIEKIKTEFPDWTAEDGLCSRCVDYYHTEVVMAQRMLPEIGPYFPIKSADDFVILPTPLRMDADPRYTGKGITICFIDSGFCFHPDLTISRNRIKVIVDITKTSDAFPPETGQSLEGSAWHGTMTSVVCGGDGHLSKGLYKGIASEADLVLLKVQDAEGRITTENITRALQWVLEHQREYDIRIINMSLGDDETVSYKESKVDQLAEELIRRGVVIVAAAGNDEHAAIKPPANSPAVITVGGIDDDNRLEPENIKTYHSSYGNTIDGFLKPELVSHAIWVAAPILPGTKEHEEAKTLHQLIALNDFELREVLEKNLSTIGQNLQIDNIVFTGNDVIYARKLLIRRIQETKFFSPDYMHVDGSSFAAPVVCAVIAQLLQANPVLTPTQIRKVLFSTAKRLPLPVERQGFGIVNPRKALLKILKKEITMKPQQSPFINPGKKTIEFFIENRCASQISLSGSFNRWAQDVLLMEPAEDGLWKIEIPMLPAGKYHYKFFIDDKMWVEDIDNPYREPDGLNGWNSVLIVDHSNESFRIKNEMASA